MDLHYYVLTFFFILLILVVQSNDKFENITIKLLAYEYSNDLKYLIF